MTIGTSNVGSIISQTLAVPYTAYKVTATVPSGTLDYASSMTETGYDTLYVLKWGSNNCFQNFKRKATNGTQNMLSLRKRMKMNLQSL